MKKKIILKTKQHTPLKPTIKINMNDIETYDDLVTMFATAKINAGYDISVSEFMAVLNAECIAAEELFNCVFKVYDEELDNMNKKNNKLYKKLEWATRPWYEKLMFWKKDPNK